MGRTGIDNMLRRKDGFTLLEVLVAFVLLASVVTVIVQLFSSNLKTLSLTEDYLSATIKAETRMREILADDTLTESAWTETTADGYRIDVAVNPAFEGRTKDLPLKMLEIVVAMTWKKGTKSRTLTLRTMKTVKRQINTT